MLRAIKLRVKKILDQLALRRHRANLKKQLGKESPRYEQYLDLQLRRTLSKKKAPLKQRTQILVDKVAELTNLRSSDVLCVGCRNTAEIDYFRASGAKSVIGIDLYSENPAILLMDMHQMTFPDHHFDMIYSSHSLEHAYDVQKVVNEFIRVGRPRALVVIEVPVCYQTRGADLVDFKDGKTLHRLFEPYLKEVLWCEEQDKLSDANLTGTKIVRTIFSLEKPT